MTNCVSESCINAKHKIINVSLLLHINRNDLYMYVLLGFISAHSHLNVISGGLWQVFVEPWRIVECAASV